MAVTKALQILFENHSRFLLIGLTGRTGSGCSTAAALLASKIVDLNLEKPENPLTTADERKYRVLSEFATKNWVPFHVISVTQVILSFVLDAERKEVDAFFKEYLKEKDRDGFLAEFEKYKAGWQKVSQVVEPGTNRGGMKDLIKSFLEYWYQDLGEFLRVLRRALAGKFAPTFQALGDNLRRSGNPFSNVVSPDAFFVLPVRVCEVAVVIRHINATNDLKTHIAIDALRNPFEIEYFRNRFAPFFLLAVNTDDDDRTHRLSEIGGLSFSEISKLDAKEYPAENKPLDGYDQFVSQDIQACIAKADVFVHNPGRVRPGQVPQLSMLKRQLIKFVSLMQHSGLVTPTKIERCMQVAYSAKANSGCISRQVGAVVTDSNFSIKAVGWNDVPEGQVTCLLRSADDLIKNADEQGFSVYEFSTVKFREHVAAKHGNRGSLEALGLPCPYCFKSQYNSLEHPRMKGGNQVHTRSLHAEENAFLQIAKYGGAGIQNGILFTTASPCELCAKKAYQLGIKEVYFIDPYPGISRAHILGAGSLDRRPKTFLFSGAVGQAFHRLYDPMLPFKDEIAAYLNDVG